MMYFFALQCPYMPIYRRNMYEGTKISVTSNFVVCVCERWLRWSAADSANMIPAFDQISSTMRLMTDEVARLEILSGFFGLSLSATTARIFHTCTHSYTTDVQQSRYSDHR